MCSTTSPQLMKDADPKAANCRPRRMSSIRVLPKWGRGWEVGVVHAGLKPAANQILPLGKYTERLQTHTCTWRHQRQPKAEWAPRQHRDPSTEHCSDFHKVLLGSGWHGYLFPTFSTNPSTVPHELNKFLSLKTWKSLTPTAHFSQSIFYQYIAADDSPEYKCGGTVLHHNSLQLLLPYGREVSNPEHVMTSGLASSAWASVSASQLRWTLTYAVISHLRDAADPLPSASIPPGLSSLSFHTFPQECLSCLLDSAFNKIPQKQSSCALLLLTNLYLLCLQLGWGRAGLCSVILNNL